MSTERKINKKATTEKILEVAKDSIHDMNSFNKLMEDDEDIKAVALLWEVELVYM